MHRPERNAGRSGAPGRHTGRGSGLLAGVLGGLALVLATAPARSTEPPDTLQPYTARYQVSYRGLHGGP